MPTRTKQLLAVVLLAGCYIGIASVTRPGDTLAGDMSAPDAALPTDSPDLLTTVSLGEMAGRDVTIRVFAGLTEPVYTVVDRDGAVLADRVTADELRERYPELPDVRQFFNAADDAPVLMGDAPACPGL
ncbi:MAG: hypothetical protein KAS72_06175 [Phycisphaerales bacterium]|nr:hypothetical protein [Phycisphaerales bacterium]